jgi:hypothetical protein
VPHTIVLVSSNSGLFLRRMWDMVLTNPLDGGLRDPHWIGSNSTEEGVRLTNWRGKDVHAGVVVGLPSSSGPLLSKM